ncbi:MAG: hypothetical protein HRU20_21795 [Pseudomonadales bacterium]|nr:hypothetical protein [Pseudomonadales bacterium]
MLPPYKAMHNTADYYYQQMNPAIESGLNYEQKQEVKRLLRRAINEPSKKLVSHEMCFFFLKRFYMVFYLGLDKRNCKKRTDENRAHILSGLFLTLGLRLLLWGSSVLLLAAVISYSRTVLWIDFIQGQHIQDYFSITISN